MAAPTGPREASIANMPGFEGFPFAGTSSSRPQDDDGKAQGQAGDVKKKPCRTCTDFKSWMKQQKQASAAAQVTGLKQLKLSGICSHQHLI